METNGMGQVLAEAKIENLDELWASKRGLEKTGSKRVTSSTGGGEANLYSAVRLTVQAAPAR